MTSTDTIDDRNAKIIAILPKCTGSVSLVCSALLINHLVHTPGQLSKVSNRLLLGLSVSDMLYTFIMPFLSSWMVPSDLFDAYGNEVNVFQNTGSVRTCTMQGTIDQFAAKTSWMYNAELAFAYLVAVRFRRGERMLDRFEPLLHAVPVILGLLAAVIPLPYEAYNHAGGAFCWIAPSPGKCESVEKGDGGQACQRGKNYVNLRIWLSFIPCFVTQLIVLLSMLGVIWTVFRIERKSDRYVNSTGPTNSLSQASRKYTKKVALKCVLYVLAFEITWFFNLWGAVEFWANNENDHETAGPLALDEGGWPAVKYLLNLALLPTYGIWSSIAYFILPFLKARKEHPEWGILTRVRKTVFPPSRTRERAGWRFREPVGRSHNSEDEVTSGPPPDTPIVPPAKASLMNDGSGQDPLNASSEQNPEKGLMRLASIESAEYA